MNVSDIKLALDEMGVTYPEDAKKAELEALLQEAEEAAAALVTAATGETPSEPIVDAPGGLTALTVACVMPAGGLNVRAEPGGAVAFVAPPNARAAVMEMRDDGWTRVGIEGWVRQEFLG